ncbi:Fic family protein [bacterium]|nr:MAG: Fic family protein [bacterium]
MEDSLTKWRLENAIGATWLGLRYGIEPVQALRFRSRIAASRSVHRHGNHWETSLEERYRPEPTLRGHLEFMLKHERVHLEFLTRLFAVAGRLEIADWIKDRPTGIYARRAGFFYEWLTGKRVDFDGVVSGGYVDALEPEKYFTATTATNDPRWRVRDNLPGDRRFCPTVLLTDTVEAKVGFDVFQAWKKLEKDFGEDLLARSAVWLTLKESRSSFAIEGERNEGDRIRRFAAALETEAGQHENLFEEDTLRMIQRTILGEVATRYGIRRSPIFVGETRGLMDVVHYVAPHWDMIGQMLEGLTAVKRRTQGGNSLLRAAVLSFGFVYIHPLTDGNGRISRFLINDVLRRDGMVPEPFVLPVSAVISADMRGYDRALEIFSKPLMRRYAENYRFGKNGLYEDGLTSNFFFDAYQDAEPAWRFPDLTDHAEYLGIVITDTVEDELRTEARQIAAYRSARQMLNEVIEASDPELDRIVRSIRENAWKISNKLRRDFPMLEDADVARRAIDAVRDVLIEI